MNPRGVSATKFSGQQILAFVQQMKEQMASLASSSSSSNLTGFELSTQTNSTTKNGPQQWDSINSALEQKDSMGFVMLKNLLNIEQKTKPLQPPPPLFFEKVRQFGPFFLRPVDMAMDLLCVFEIGKTFSIFEKLDINDKIALCSNIAMPLYVLCVGFYSVQQNCDVFCTPNNLMHIKIFTNSYFNQDLVAMKMGDKLLCKAMEPFVRLKLSTEEFVLIRAIIYSHMAGVLRYVELMGLIEFLFIAGVKGRQLLTYISNLLCKNFDRVFPPVLANIESHQLFPY
ncbi:hypothetical protein niasHT_022999 [Heterodera trifolii]|uniref:NR LBD domain-containing protein n=1 Tax=Heterodera trifolii TaxID=157864 RepID=A0ABD2JX61_9BILA